MSGHTHTNKRLTVGCPACIHEVRASQETARWATAPRRRVKWRCFYLVRLEHGRGHLRGDVSFSIVVQVPADATHAEIDDHYIDLTGEQFVMALPDSVAIQDTDDAASTMWVDGITVGAIIPDATAQIEPQPSLFGADA